MTRARRWRREDYAMTPRALARALIGRTLVRVLDGGTRLAGRIVETEAYLGMADRAAHSFGGRRTARNEAMYGPPGTAYVYFTYGMHHCFNVVCGQVDEPVAVLIRALEPIEGVGEMHLLRSGGQRRTRPIRDVHLASGPARLCQAMAIDRALNMTDLTRSSCLFIEEPAARPTVGRIRLTPRIGIDYAGSWVSRPLRYVIQGHPHASR